MPSSASWGRRGGAASSKVCRTMTGPDGPHLVLRMVSPEFGLLPCAFAILAGVSLSVSFKLRAPQGTRLQVGTLVRAQVAIPKIKGTMLRARACTLHHGACCYCAKQVIENCRLALQADPED